MTPQRLDASEQFGAALNSLALKVEMEATDRNRIVGSAFAIAMDHHAAIVQLNKDGDNGIHVLELMRQRWNVPEK